MIIGKKKLSFLLFLLPLNMLVAQQPKAVTTDWEPSQSEGLYDCYAVNHDYCHYYIDVDLSSITTHKYMGVKYTATLQPGRNSLFLFKSGSWRYYHYRGNPTAKINAKHQYALPIHPGDSVTITYNKGKLLFNLRHTSDTVYASRDGIVCNEEFIEKAIKGHTLFVYHNDGTFAHYGVLQKKMVKPGESVKTGTPIAIVYTDEEGARFFEFHIDFLDINKLEDRKSGGKHSILNPFFHTKNHGVVRLEENTTYIGEITDELIMQDMSKKEKAQYLKKKK